MRSPSNAQRIRRRRRYRDADIQTAVCQGVRPAGAPGPRSRPNLQMALYGANRSLVFEPTDNLLDAHLSSLTTISALTFSVAILSFVMPRLKSRVVNSRDSVNCRELFQSSAQHGPKGWSVERNGQP